VVYSPFSFSLFLEHNKTRLKLNPFLYDCGPIVQEEERCIKNVTAELREERTGPLLVLLLHREGLLMQIGFREDPFRMVEPILRAERGLARGKGWKGCSLPGR
jgi:hypothetical protein